MRHVLLRGAVSSAIRRDLDRVGGGEEDVRNDGASSRSCSSMQKVDGIKRRAVWKHVRGDGGAEGVRSSAEWWEQSWQDRVGDVRDDGASSRSGSFRQKVGAIKRRAA